MMFFQTSAFHAGPVGASRHGTRGFPTTIALAASFLFMFFSVPILRLVAVFRRQKTRSVPLITEPEDYLPSGRWLQQFPGRRLEDLGARQGLRALTGATLSSRAVTQAARRVLALHRLFVAAPRESAPGGSKP